MAHLRTIIVLQIFFEITDGNLDVSDDEQYQLENSITVFITTYTTRNDLNQKRTCHLLDDGDPANNLLDANHLLFRNLL